MKGVTTGRRFYRVLRGPEGPHKKRVSLSLDRTHGLSRVVLTTHTEGPGPWWTRTWLTKSPSVDEIVLLRDRSLGTWFFVDPLWSSGRHTHSVKVSPKKLRQFVRLLTPGSTVADVRVLFGMWVSWTDSMRT